MATGDDGLNLTLETPTSNIELYQMTMANRKVVAYPNTSRGVAKHPLKGPIFEAIKHCLYNSEQHN